MCVIMGTDTDATIMRDMFPRGTHAGTTSTMTHWIQQVAYIPSDSFHHMRAAFFMSIPCGLNACEDSVGRILMTDSEAYVTYHFAHLDPVDYYNKPSKRLFLPIVEWKPLYSEGYINQAKAPWNLRAKYMTSVLEDPCLHFVGQCGGGVPLAKQCVRGKCLEYHSTMVAQVRKGNRDVTGTRLQSPRQTAWLSDQGHHQYGDDQRISSTGSAWTTDVDLSWPYA